MRITILTAGSQGDVQPFIVLGEALQNAGYDVRVAVPQNFEPLVRQNGLNFYPISVDFQQLLNSDAGRKLIGSGQNPIRVMREGNPLMRSVLWQMVQDLWDACQESAAVISHIGLMVVAKSIADKLAVPLVIGALQPLAPTRSFPHPMWPLRANLNGVYNHFTGQMMEQLTWQIFQSAANRLRQEKLNLSPLSASQFFKSMKDIPVLNAFSAHIVPRPADWRENQYITGFWFSVEASDW